ncbi:MAG: hypothetical protein WC455_21685 [Dehalococcoidia bacterium]|jgi:hypothetical protein
MTNTPSCEHVDPRLKKLKALAERGVGGEKENAKRLLENLCNKYQISPDQIESFDEKKMRWFRHQRGRRFKHLLCQCMYKTLGEGAKKYTHGKASEIGVECTAAQGMEIELDYAFYSDALEVEIERLVEMFIQKNDIFPPNCVVSSGNNGLTEEDISLYRGIKKHTRVLKISGNGE